MKQITSLSNPIIKKVLSLHTSKGRSQHRLFIAEGIRTCMTFVEHGFVPIELLVTTAFLEKTNDNALNALKIQRSAYTCVSEQIMKKISTTTTPSGIFAVFPLPQPLPKHELTAGVVLAQLQDPGNMGTLIRTAAAVGVRSIVVVEGTDPWSPKVIQACAGTIALVRVFEWSWETLLNNKKHLQLCGLVVQGGTQPQALSPHTSLIVVGNEGHGLPAPWQHTCDMLVSLPMPGNTESLNAAVAGSIALYLTYINT